MTCHKGHKTMMKENTENIVKELFFFNRDLNGLVCWVWASFFLFGEHRGKRLFPVQTLSENKKIENLVHFTELAYP